MEIVATILVDYKMYCLFKLIISSTHIFITLFSKKDP